jgi:hypothetical protein
LLLLIAIKRTLNGIDEWYIQNIEEDLSGCQVVTPSKAIRFVVEPFIIFADHHREYFDLVAIIR